MVYILLTIGLVFADALYIVSYDFVGKLHPSVYTSSTGLNNCSYTNFCTAGLRFSFYITNHSRNQTRLSWVRHLVAFVTSVWSASLIQTPFSLTFQCYLTKTNALVFAWIKNVVMQIILETWKSIALQRSTHPVDKHIRVNRWITSMIRYVRLTVNVLLMRLYNASYRLHNDIISHDI